MAEHHSFSTVPTPSPALASWLQNPLGTTVHLFCPTTFSTSQTMIAGKVKPICNYEDNSFLPRKGENQSFRPAAHLADEQQRVTNPFSPRLTHSTQATASLSWMLNALPAAHFPFKGTSCTLLKRLQWREASHQAAKRPGNCPLLEIICNGQDEEKELSFVAYFLPFFFF